MTPKLPVLLVCLCVLGCGDDDSLASKADASAREADASASKADAGASKADAGASKADSGASQADSDAGETDAGYADAGMSPVFIAFNIRPNADCTYPPMPSMFFPVGRYDVSGTQSCEQPYVAHLLVNSTWRSERGGDERLDVASAKVTLRALDGSALVFTGPTLPNPFTVTTTLLELASATDSQPMITALLALELIPSAYRAGLQTFASTQVVATVALEARTSNADPVDVNPFSYPIEICSGCLTRCDSKLRAQHLTRQDVLTPNACVDNSGTDDRFCIDPDC